MRCHGCFALLNSISEFSYQHTFGGFVATGCYGYADLDHGWMHTAHLTTPEGYNLVSAATAAAAAAAAAEGRCMWIAPHFNASETCPKPSSKKLSV